jgi:hypothetical protein
MTTQEVQDRLTQLKFPDPTPLTADQRLARWRHQFRTTPSLREEFSRETVYLAYMKARHDGRLGTRAAAV